MTLVTPELLHVLQRYGTLVTLTDQKPNQENTMKTIETIRHPSGKTVELQLHNDAYGNDSGADACYFMHGPTGNHTLDVDVTDDERLAAHWEGFCQMNDVANKAMRLKAADPALVKPSHTTELDVQRCNYLLELVTNQLQDLDQKAGTLRATWEDATAAQHLREKLLDLTCDDDKRAALMAEIDRELEA